MRPQQAARGGAVSVRKRRSLGGRGSAGYVAVGVSVAVIAVALAGVLGRGNLDHLIRFRNGGLFVHSSEKQQLHHVDLASGKVDYAVPLDGGAYDVVNSGGVTVARNRQTRAATVIDLSDATGKASRALLLDGAAELVAGGGKVFALDRGEGTATPIDTTGATAGMPAKIGGRIEGTAAVDAEGRLWAPVPSRGEIVPVDVQQERGRIVGTIRSAPRLAEADVPLDVTVFNRVAFGVVHRSGTTEISRLALGAAARPLSYPGQLSFAAVQGEVDGTHLAGLDRANGLVVRIDVRTGEVLPFQVPGLALRDLGPPLQAGNKLIVPDPSRGEVVVIDADRPGTRSVISVAANPGPLDVQVKDRSVLVNAPGGSKALQVDQHGNIQTIDKYVPVPAATDPVRPAAPTPPTPAVRPVPTPASGGRGPQAPPVTVPPQAPGPPVNLAATAGKGQVALSWQPPRSGGATVTGYVIAGPRGDTQVGGGTRTATLAADNEVPVTFRIRAVNAVGSSPSASFPTVTPHSQVPGAVGSLRATPGNGKVDFAWPAAAANGTTIDRYVITGSHGTSMAVPSGATSFTWDPLANGTSYTFSIRAVASSGASGAAAGSGPVVPFGPPTPPSGFTVVPLDGGLRVSFTPSPGDGNGRSVERYEVSSASGAVAAPPPGTAATKADPPPHELAGLSNGTSYSVWVRTVTAAAGPGPWSRAERATPAGVPSVSLSARADGDRTIRATLTVTDNGSSPRRCVLVVNGAEQPASCTGSNVVGGLDYRAYDVSAYAENAAGRSGRSNVEQVVFTRPEYRETLQSWPVETKTWRGTNASGQGPNIPRNATVVVSCRKHDPTVRSNIGGWWYRVKSSPWDDQFYAPAGDFKSAPVNTAVPGC